MIFRVENLEVNTKEVFKVLAVTCIGVGLYKMTRKPKVCAACVVVNEEKKDA